MIKLSILEGLLKLFNGNCLWKGHDCRAILPELLTAGHVSTNIAYTHRLNLCVWSNVRCMSLVGQVGVARTCWATELRLTYAMVAD